MKWKPGICTLKKITTLNVEDGNFVGSDRTTNFCRLHVVEEILSINVHPDLFSYFLHPGTSALKIWKSFIFFTAKPVLVRILAVVLSKLNKTQIIYHLATPTMHNYIRILSMHNKLISTNQIIFLHNSPLYM